MGARSLSARRAWIEIGAPTTQAGIHASLSARRAWIEMFLSMGLDGRFKVALRKESVDRNKTFSCFFVGGINVALRKESVDRNQGVHYDNYNLHVALRKESVDRNRLIKKNRPSVGRSLSARRAWIEIPAGCWRDARRACRSPQGERG